MSDAQGAARRPMGLGPGGGPPRRPPGRLWSLQVEAVSEVTPRMRRVVFSGEALGELEHKPAQDLVLILPQPGGEPARRHYTIRSHDPEAGRLTIDFVLHDHGSPAMRWLASAKPGDKLDAQGPRGRTVINREADWHLFVGDETCLPGIWAMLEKLPASARAFVFLEVADAGEEQPVKSSARVEMHWIHRGGPAQPGSKPLVAAVEAFALPPGEGQAYLIGETSTVRAQRHSLIARGLDKTKIAAEGYWRPGRHGGHDHIFDPGEGPPFGRPGVAPRPEA